MTTQNQARSPAWASNAANEFSAAGQAQSLTLLLSEMKALGLLLPGVAEVSRDEDEIEAEFDNMPV